MDGITYEFLSAKTLCQPVASVTDLDFSHNKIHVLNKGIPVHYRTPDFFLDDDDLRTISLVSVPLADMRNHAITPDETFIATLKNVCLEKFSQVPIVSNTFNLFAAPSVAIAESYHSAFASDKIAEAVGEKLFPDNALFPNGIRLHEAGEPGMVVTEPCFLLASRFVHHNYYHWMVEALPRLALLEELPNHQSIPLVFPSLNTLPFHRASFQAMGLRNPIIHMNVRLASFERLYFPSFLDPGTLTPRHAAWLRSRLFPEASAAGRADRPRRLYVSRRDAQARGLTNEEEVIALLAPLGFEIVVPGSLTMEEQIRTFAAAEIVVAPHGAGNTNIVFCRPDAILIELVPEAVKQCHYWMLASVAGLRYGRLLCAPAPTGLSMTVDIGRLRELLGRAGLG